MAKVGGSTQFEDARRALRKAIYDTLRQTVTTTDWVTKVPGKNPHDGYACSAARWTSVLRDGAAIMAGMGYGMAPVSVADGTALAGRLLTDSVAFLDGKVSSAREKWVRFSVRLDVTP